MEKIKTIKKREMDGLDLSMVLIGIMFALGCLMVSLFAVIMDL